MEQYGVTGIGEDHHEGEVPGEIQGVGEVQMEEVLSSCDLQIGRGLDVEDQ